MSNQQDSLLPSAEKNFWEKNVTLPKLVSGKLELHQAKKYRTSIIVAVAVFVITIAVMGFIVAFLCSAGTSEHLIKSQKIMHTLDGEEYGLDMEGDLDRNVAVFTEHQQEGDLMSVEDFNKKLSVLLINNVAEPYCAALFVHSTSSQEWSGFVQDMDHPADIKVNSTSTIVSYLQKDSSPIADVSFLDKRAQAMCQGYAVYWLRTTCQQETSNPPKDNDLRPHREKRESKGQICKPHCYYTDWCNCCQVCMLCGPAYMTCSKGPCCNCNKCT